VGDMGFAVSRRASKEWTSHTLALSASIRLCDQKSTSLKPPPSCSRVPAVFHLIFCSSGEVLGDDGPLVSEKVVRSKKNRIFNRFKRSLHHVWGQCMIPSFSTLLRDTTRQMLRDCSPLNPVGFDHT
jgi:hypothetical protein